MKIGEMNAIVQGASHRYSIWIKDRSGKWLFEILEKKVVGGSEEISILAVILSEDEIMMVLPLIWKAIVDVNLVDVTIEDIVAKVMWKDAQ